MVKVQIDREMLVRELYELRALLDSTEQDARNKLDAIVNLVQNSPTDELKARFPRTQVSRG